MVTLNKVIKHNSQTTARPTDRIVNQERIL